LFKSLKPEFKILTNFKFWF